jgi:glucose-6-phosphate isomerase, archaeal
MNPFASNIHLPEGLLTPHHNHITRRLSSMKGQYADQPAFDTMLAQEDTLIYEVYENKVPEVPGQLLHGTSIVHPGKVGDEYFMTKGHFHKVLATAEVYYCLHGHGFMMMETPEGESSAMELLPGMVLYVPPCWAHRSINIGNDDLVTLFIYPGDAGHDYGTIETKGFRKIIVENDSQPAIVDNPHWLAK